MMFSIYINDLPYTLLTCIKLFADDTKLYWTVSSDVDWQAQQSDL